MRWQGLPGRAVLGIGMGRGTGTVPLLLSVEADLASPPNGLRLHAQGRQSRFCCMKLLPLLFEVFSGYNLVFPDSYLPLIN